MYDCDGPLMSKTEAIFFWGGIALGLVITGALAYAL